MKGGCTYFCVFVAEPDHERSLSNMAYFERVRRENPEQFIDEELESMTDGSGRLDYSERELYEATCREGKPLVRNSVPSVFSRLAMTCVRTWQ